MDASKFIYDTVQLCLNQEANKEMAWSVNKIMGQLPSIQTSQVHEFYNCSLKIRIEQLTLSNPAMFLFSAKNSAGDSAAKSPDKSHNASVEGPNEPKL